MESAALTLSELSRRIRDLLANAFAETFWIKAEINAFDRYPSGHCYLQFVEIAPDTKQELTRMRGMIWAQRYAGIASKFQQGAQRVLGPNMQVLVQVKVEYHAKFGLALQVVDIDPSYTVGEMALKRAQALQRLQQEDLLVRNKRQCLPTLPRRIALVSSSNAAGYGDFCKQTERAARFFGLQIELYNVTLQGATACASMVAALRAIAGQVDRFDVVIIVRGGGSLLDLSVFDEYELARAIALMPLPVLTGIGHDRNTSLSDLVAFQAFKTPTAVGEFLVQRFAGQLAMLRECGIRIHHALEKGLEEKMACLRLERERAARHLERTLTTLANARPDAGRARYAIASHLDRQRIGLRELALRAVGEWQRSAQRYEYDLRLIESKVPELDPAVNMRRGYALVERDNQPISAAQQVHVGELLQLHMQDGLLLLEVKDGGYR